MCPACIATSLALVAGTLTATGGVTALIAKTLHRKIEARIRRNNFYHRTERRTK
jgi:hypothetical protein